MSFSNMNFQDYTIHVMIYIYIEFQWTFQEPKLEVPTICKAYVRECPHKIWPYMVITVPPFLDPEFPVDSCK